jgi:hypothetical protein
VDVVVAVEKCVVLTSSWRVDGYTELLCPTVKRKTKEKMNFWTKTGLRVCNGEGNRRSARISPTAASAVARRSGGHGGWC